MWHRHSCLWAIPVKSREQAPSPAVLNPFQSAVQSAVGPSFPISPITQITCESPPFLMSVLSVNQC